MFAHGLNFLFQRLNLLSLARVRLFEIFYFADQLFHTLVEQGDILRANRKNHRGYPHR